MEELAEDETTTDSFEYTVTDSKGGFSTETVKITIKGANDAPFAVDDVEVTRAVRALSVDATNGLLANDYDVDQDDIFKVTDYDSVSALGASVTVNADGSYTYDASALSELTELAIGESAIDSFNYTVKDSKGGTSTATMTITVTGNSIGVAGVETAFLQEDSDDNVLGSTGADTITLRGAAQVGDKFDGGAGFDTLILADRANEILVSGTESIIGGSKNDTFNLTSIDFSTIEGGDGIDTVNYSIVHEGLSIDLDAGTVNDLFGNLGDTLTSIEAASGTAYDDVVSGTADDNILRGFAGNDVLVLSLIHI